MPFDSITVKPLLTAAIFHECGIPDALLRHLKPGLIRFAMSASRGDDNKHFAPDQSC